MIEKKPLIWFMSLAFAISWSLFLLPLVLPNVGVTTAWSLAMWGPGIAAILATVHIAGKGLRGGLKELGLGRLGRLRFYWLAWFLPPVLVLMTLLLTVLLHFGQFDPSMTFVRQSLEAAGRGNAPPQPAVISQIVVALLLGPLVNLVFTLGEEIGWRGFLLPRLLPLGRWPAILVSGAIWGFWHAPVVAQGLNYPSQPILLGIPMTIVFCVLGGTFLSWLYLETGSSWVAGLAHASINAWGNLPLVFLLPGINLLLGGTVASISGWVAWGILISVLIFTRRLPDPGAAAETTAIP